MKAILFLLVSAAALFAAPPLDIVLTLRVPDDPTLCWPNDVAPITITGDRVTSIQLPKNRKIAFTDGLVPIRANGKWGYMDSKNRIAVPPRFDDARQFSQGRAVVIVGQRYGYIDRTGSYVAEPQFSWGYPFDRGVASVCFGERWGLIDLHGQWVVKPHFKRLDLLEGGLFAESATGEQGFIDTRGAFIRKGPLGTSYQPAK